MPFVTIENATLFYEEQGNGAPLILIHGAWTSHQWWQWQIPALSRTYRILALDLRGHGRSTPLDSTYSVAGFTADVETFLRQLAIDEAVFIGWSLGGSICLQYCLNFPEKVKGLILIATRAHLNFKLKLRTRLVYLQARLSLMMALSQPRKYEREAQCFPGPGHHLIQRQLEDMLSPTVSKEIFAWIKQDLIEHPQNNYFEVFKSFWNWEAGAALAQIHAPVLLMAGKNDSWAPPYCAALIQREITNSRLVALEDAGHCLALEKPEKVNAEILRFLNDIGY
jgi:3-oxoadipate enol-lactonase